MDDLVITVEGPFNPSGYRVPRVKWTAVNFNMMLLHDAFSEHGNIYAFLKPHVFSPIKIEQSSWAIRNDKAHIFDVPHIGKTSLGVNNFWASSIGWDRADESGRKEGLAAHSGLHRVAKKSAWGNCDN